MADVCNSHERAPRNAVNVTAEIEIAQAQVIASSPVPEATALIAALGACGLLRVSWTPRIGGS
jgi:hypothetical protein